MKIKVLLVPTIIIFSGFVAINYLMPDFYLYIEKRAERDNAKMHAEKAETVVRNAVSQKAELEQNQEKVSFLNRFVPQQKDEARSLDNFNFLITQSGLITSRIAIQGVLEKKGADSVFAVTDQVPADPLALEMPNGAGALTMPMKPTYKAPESEEYTVILEGVGGYQNIKELITKLGGFDRLNTFQSLKITTTKNGTAEGEETSTAGTLTVILGILLPYQATPKLASGEAITVIPALQQSSLDVSIVDAVRSKMTDTVPDSVLGTDGKSNPFE
jgi:Tfp pilus assembly protein PilO